MFYKVKISGYRLVEADSPEEAKEKADNQDYIEEYLQLGKVLEEPDY